VRSTDHPGNFRWPLLVGPFADSASRLLFGWEPVDDRAYARAWDVQRELTKRGQHRSAGPVDLVVAATAELRGLTLLHRDHDFDCVVGVTGQPHQWFGST
jgi:predicted nucleic acid-binding protein